MRFSMIFGLFMQNTILAYWLYQLTHDSLSIGLLGLFEAVPAIGFSLISGHIVDEREKKSMLRTCFISYLLLSVGYFALSALLTNAHITVSHTQMFIYCGVFVNGVIRAFLSPASFSLLGMLVPRKLYANASTWSSTSWQTGNVLGPLAAGILIATLGIPVSLGCVIGVQLVGFVAVMLIPKQPILKKAKEPMMHSLKEGLRFVFSNQLILATLCLDMFAVLFGGATALLPAYAHDILKVGVQEFGWMRAAPGIGAIIMFFGLAWMPLKTKPGIKLMLCIAAFGVSFIIFGFSTNFYLSMAMLFLGGMFDAVSVVIRGTIFQLYTPDAMRGRVSAVNTMFISSSNEIGELESGITAKWMGTVPAVVFGGCMTLIVVATTYFVAPKMRELKLEIEEKKKEDAPA